MVKKIFLFICVAMVISPSLATADNRGEEYLVELAARVRDMGCYESDIRVKIQSDFIEGRYRVCADNFHIELDNIEFWGIGDKRYEVSHKTEEVVIERADQNNNTLLSNPAHAFDFVERGFDVQLQERGSDIILNLVPKSEEDVNIDVDQIVIYLDSATQLPTKIVYQANDDMVEVEIMGIKKSKSSLIEFKTSSYRKYDIIDLY